MNVWGISALSHDAALSVLVDGKIKFAAHAERYSRVKNDKYLHEALYEDALEFGEPDKIVWYERPGLKLSRQLYAGQWSKLFAQRPRTYMKKQLKRKVPITYVDHHRSHAAAGYYTSNFDNAAILILDAIGEWTTGSIWEARGEELKLVERQVYPHSLGLFYSALTQYVGLKPNEEEYILMGMSAFGMPLYYDELAEKLLNIGAPWPLARVNMHRGVRDTLKLPDAHAYDLAASAQAITEDVVLRLVDRARQKVSSNNLILGGGVALNCVANSYVASAGFFDKVWIMPNPGDAGSSLGAALVDHGKHVSWPGPYLGHKVEEHVEHPSIVSHLLEHKLCGRVSGRAEFGPRALGNRSLLADPRGPDVKDLVNQVKQREPFRPFAPAILAEHLPQFFDAPVSRSPYMQFTAICKRPDLFPAIVHHDGTSRVQTVTRQDNPTFYKLLQHWHHATGCPMLLNTSLNIKGEPLVNTQGDGRIFQEKYNVRVFGS